MSPDIFWWGGGLPREGVGAKKFGISSKPRESNFFGGISRDFAGISRKRPKSLRKKCLGSIFGPYTTVLIHDHRINSLSVRKTREGWNCRFQKTPRTEGGDKVQAVSSRGSRQVCLSRCPKPRTCIAKASAPYRGQNRQNRGKRVPWSKNSHFQVPQKWVLWVKKIPISLQGSTRNWGFFDSKRPFLGHLEMGVFWPRNPLSPILAILTPVGGGRFRKTCNISRP